MKARDPGSTPKLWGLQRGLHSPPSPALACFLSLSVLWFSQNNRKGADCQTANCPGMSEPSPCLQLSHSPELEGAQLESLPRRPSTGSALGAPPARCPSDTHADDRSDEQQHQHGDVEDNDTQQQEEHCSGKFCSAEFLPAGRESRSWT